MYQGDIRLGDTLYFHFTTRRFSTGAPFTLAGTPVISAYPQDSTTQLTAGITLTVDLDSVTGLNSVKVVATSGNGYVTGTNYSLVITTGTVDSVSVVGEVIGSFSIEARSALMPTVAGRTVDVTATGAAGIDWANVENPTTTVNLSGTSVKTATDVETDTQDIQSRLPAALVSGRIDSSVGAYQSGLTPLQPTVAGRTLDVTATGEAGIDWANIGSPTTAVNLSATNIDVDQVVASVTGAVGSVTAGVTVTTNNDKTGYSIGVGGIGATAFAAGAIDAAALAASASQEIADGVLNRNLATGSDGGRNVQSALRTLRNKVDIAVGGAVTVYEEDDATPAWTGTATRNALADPITSIDPA